MEIINDSEDFTRYRVELVCYVDVPKGGFVDHETTEGEMRLYDSIAAFAMAYNQIADDEADEVWILPVPKAAVEAMRRNSRIPIGGAVIDG